ncbi:hypothetical protein L226DRAFT_567428 [Lentinus tigrinus ALCF2SS1-7]|uniref:F-box domain-containing protein n=1 Tax=Lentinus tigrinus ALCF2SS1-6 TaxID=1328759 RepID=A0A5C2SND5_9APHY|nr:hypothetical protein L227DRAFT_606846 [Lentinus tigrinus ALCF2SS1-6]RPD79277.1 hypothetical protein L226DRAFT_567428 [Lentinus tigrinus ALCF2SS1-7]
MPRVLSHVELGAPEGSAGRRDPQTEGRLSYVEEFTSFVLGNPDVHARQIRSLTLHWNAIVPLPPVSKGHVEHIPSLVEVIRHASNLRKLNISMAESLFELSAALFDVIVSHDRLRTLELTYVSEKALALLAGMKSGLEEIALEGFRDDSPFDFACLRPHMATLKVFRMRRFQTMRSPRVGDVWGRVHTLELHKCHDYLPEAVTSLPRAFPHVHVLSIRTLWGQGVSMPPIAWPSVKALELSLVCLNLTTPIRFLRLDRVHGAGLPLQFFEHLQPSALTLDMHRSHWLPRVQAASSLRTTLRYLQLQSSEITWLVDGQSNQLKKLSKLRLRALVAISMCTYVTDYAPEAQESIARHLVAFFPSVKLVGFGYDKSVSGALHFPPTTWYRVGRKPKTKGADGVVIEAALPTESATIIEYVENLIGRAK